MLTTKNNVLKIFIFLSIVLTNYALANSLPLNWTHLNPATSPSARENASIAFDSCSGQIIVFGGYDGNFLNDTWAFNGKTNTWTHLTNSLAGSPTARQSAAMAFDQGSGRIVMFGGYDGNSLNDTWAFDGKTNTWINLTSSLANSPSGRQAASMTFDPCSGNIILFGGYNGSSLFNETWALDISAKTWTNLTSSFAASPSARQDASMSFDPSSGEIILFGGSNGNFLNETWTLDTSAKTWTNLTSSLETSPSARQAASMAFDPCSGNIILFGGNSGNPLNDTWAFEAKSNKWKNLTFSNGISTTPSPRQGASMTFDPCSGKIILFGGHNGDGYSNDTWAFGTPDAKLSWNQLNPATSPSNRHAASVAFDPCNGQVILFGGVHIPDGYLQDTWTFDVKANTWINVTPSDSPVPRAAASMAFDSCSGKAILFGGNTQEKIDNDTWAFDAKTKTWTKLNPSNPPGARQFASMAFDPCSGRIILFGGGNTLINDTWAFDGKTNTWTDLTPLLSISPPARDWAPMAFDPCSGQLILFGGGGENSYLNDTWAFDGKTNTWTHLTPSLSNSPPARQGSSMVFNPCSGQLILFGGSNSDTLFDDTWAFDAKANKWTNLTTTTPITTSPSNRMSVAMAFNPSNGQILLFGGFKTIIDYLDDTWAFGMTFSPQITSASTATFNLGASSSFTVTTTGYPTPSITKTGALPSGITFVDNGDGTATLTGTPVTGSEETRSLTLTAANGISPDAVQNFTLIIQQAPAITSDSTATFTVGTSSSFNVTTTGYPIPSITETGALPSGITFADNGDGTAILSGTPAVCSGGSYSLALTAANGVSPEAMQNFNLIIQQAPAITSASTDTFKTGIFSSFNVTTTGYPAPSITKAGILPSGIAFIDNGDGTATLSGTPADGLEGNQSLTLTAANGVSPDAVQNFTLIIQQAPAIASASTATFKTGIFSSFNVTATGYPTPSITETGVLPSGITFVNHGDGTATLSGTPAANSGGNYPLTLTAANGVSPDAVQKFTLIVQQHPAITSASKAIFTVGIASSFKVTTTGYSIPSITETGALPAGITLIDKGDGTATLSGIPAANSGGSYSLTLTAANGVSPDAVQHFTLLIQQPPTITSASTFIFTAGTSSSFTVKTKGYPTAAISKSGELPPGITLTDNGDGTATLSGTPAFSKIEDYSFILIAANGVSPNAMQQFDLKIREAPLITSASNIAFTVGTFSKFTVTTMGFPTPSVTESGALPSGITFIDNGDGTATLSGTPAGDTGRIYPLIFTAIDGISPDAVQHFALTIEEAPIITSPTSATFIVGIPSTFHVQTTGYPTSSISESGELPTGITFVDNGDGTATLSGTPVGDMKGDCQLNLTADNKISPHAKQNFILCIHQIPSITSASTATFPVGKYSEFTVKTAGYPTSSISESEELPFGLAFVDNGDGTATLSGTPAKGTQGCCSFVFKANNGVVSSHALTSNAAHEISGAEQNFTLNIIQQEVETETILDVSPNPSALGQINTLTATVTPASATGTVTFFDGASPIETVSLNQGAAVLNTSSLSAGTHSLLAVYNGNDPYLPSSSLSVSLMVETARPPSKLKGFQKMNKFATQTNYANFLTWKAPSSGTSIVAYHIYRDKHLKELIATIPSNRHLHFEEHNCKKGKIYSYYIVSIDYFGNTSEPASVKVGGRKSRK